VYLSIRASRLTGLSGAEVLDPFGDEPLARQRGGFAASGGRHTTLAMHSLVLLPVFTRAGAC
jgi:hypothetical protein